jgi:hypothetical protein
MSSWMNVLRYSVIPKSFISVLLQLISKITSLRESNDNLIIRYLAWPKYYAVASN